MNSERLTIKELLKENRAKERIILDKDMEIDRLREQLAHHQRRRLAAYGHNGRNRRNGRTVERHYSITV